jgi:hypothetical protein
MKPFNSLSEASRIADFAFDGDFCCLILRAGIERRTTCIGHRRKLWLWGENAPERSPK